MQRIKMNKDNINKNINRIKMNIKDIGVSRYYIDKNENVYQTEDIVTNRENPKIIAKYVKEGEKYSIPFDFQKKKSPAGLRAKCYGHAPEQASQCA